MESNQDPREVRTQAALARRGIVTDLMRTVAADEGVPVEAIVAGLASGHIVIPANPAHRNLHPVGIGEGLKIKVNVNLGRSQTTSCLTEEVGKVGVALKYGADAVMDLSTGPDIDDVRAAVLLACPVPLGTVPVYQAIEKVADVIDLTEDDFLDVVREQLGHRDHDEVRLPAILARGA